jgi:hypothetical protein
MRHVMRSPTYAMPTICTATACRSTTEERMQGDSTGRLNVGRSSRVDTGVRVPPCDGTHQEARQGDAAERSDVVLPILLHGAGVAAREQGDHVGQDDGEGGDDAAAEHRARNGDKELPCVDGVWGGGGAHKWDWPLGDTH